MSMNNNLLSFHFAWLSSNNNFICQTLATLINIHRATRQ